MPEPLTCETTSYEDWRLGVDRILNIGLGVTRADLNDYPWRTAYGDEATPLEAVIDYFDEQGDEDTITVVLTNLQAEDPRYV